MWIGLAAGTAGFILMAVSDCCEAAGRRTFSRFLFAGGLAGVCAAVLFLCAAELRRFGPPPLLRLLPCAAAAAAFLALLVYTLFFALPFRDTYVTAKKERGVCARGVYALCRHPGFWWLFGLLAALWGAARLPLAAALLFSALDLGYVLLQDSRSFPRLIAGYGAYKNETPFLIPTPASLRRCFGARGEGKPSEHRV